MRFRISRGSGIGGRINILSLQKMKRRNFRWIHYNIKKSPSQSHPWVQTGNMWSHFWHHQLVFSSCATATPFFNSTLHICFIYINFEFGLHCLKREDVTPIQQESNCKQIQAMLPRGQQSTYLARYSNSNGWSTVVSPFLLLDACYWKSSYFWNMSHQEQLTGRQMCYSVNQSPVRSNGL